MSRGKPCPLIPGIMYPTIQFSPNNSPQHHTSISVGKHEILQNLISLISEWVIQFNNPYLLEQSTQGEGLFSWISNNMWRAILEVFCMSDVQGYKL